MNSKAEAWKKLFQEKAWLSKDGDGEIMVCSGESLTIQFNGGGQITIIYPASYESQGEFIKTVCSGERHEDVSFWMWEDIVNVDFAQTHKGRVEEIQI